MPRVPDDLGKFTALTPEVKARLMLELAVGDWPQLAAFRARVSPTSMKRWLDKGLEEAAVEPYASFAADLVQNEADVAGRLMKVVLDDALGLTPEPEEGMRRPNVQSAIWLLQNRFKFFWGSRDGSVAPAGLGILELVERQLATIDGARREKAREILSKLPAEAKKDARKAGFLL